MPCVKVCQVCSREFSVKGRSGQKTCSRKCRAQARVTRVTLACARCQVEFQVIKSIAGRSRYCSYECYWKDGGPAKNAPNWKRKQEHGEVSGKRARYKHVFIGRDDNGKARYMLRSHFVWNQYHPDDPVKPGEHIHHIDHNKHNDDIGNLKKLSAFEHLSYHANGVSREERSRRMKSYASRNPGAQRKGQPKDCPVCGVTFYRPPSAKAITCSYACQGRLRRERIGKE